MQKNINGKKKKKQILKYSIQLTVTYNCLLAFADIPRYCTKLIMKKLNKGYTGTLCTTFVSFEFNRGNQIIQNMYLEQMDSHLGEK